MLITFIILSVALAAVGQLVLKHGMNQVVARSGPFELTSPESLRTVATTAAIWGGLALFGASAVLWLSVLARTSLSFAYPFAAITYVLILLFDRFVLHEPVTGLRWGGVVLIVAGILLVSRTSSG